MKIIKSAIFFLAGLCWIFQVEAQKMAGQVVPVTSAVIQVDYPYPTGDKPQSKLWYQDSCWWAILPRSNGPSLWQRTGDGWKEHPQVYRSLQGVPGRADVWNDKEGTMAVGVAADSLGVFRLFRPGPHAEWKADALATLKLPGKENIETATIARDSRGHWWVAADGDNSVYVWHSANGQTWDNAFLLKTGIDKDDICTIAAVREGVIVIWSNQVEEAVQCRVHKTGDIATGWGPETVIEKGNKTADDHLHTVYSTDGTLWVVTKNSLDLDGHPQLVLRVRNPLGSWRNYPYMPRLAGLEPSRPVIVATPIPGKMIAGHTIYDKEHSNSDYIEYGEIDTLNVSVLKNRKLAISADPGLKAKVNDCTTPKSAFPLDAPWIILASDKEGRVYEADLRN